MSCLTEQLVKICECDTAEKRQVYTQVNEYLQSIKTQWDVGLNNDTHWISVERYFEQCGSSLNDNPSDNNISSLFVCPTFESLQEDDSYQTQYMDYARGIQQQKQQQQQELQKQQEQQLESEQQLDQSDDDEQVIRSPKQVKRKSSSDQSNRSNRKSKQKKLAPISNGNEIAIPDLPGPDSVIAEFTRLPIDSDTSIRTTSYSEDENENLSRNFFTSAPDLLQSSIGIDRSAGNANLQLLLQIERAGTSASAANTLCTVAEQCFCLFPDTCHQQVHTALVQTISDQQVTLAHTFNNNISVRLKAERDTLIAQYAQTYFTWYDALITDQLSQFSQYKQNETPCFLQCCAILIAGIPFHVKCSDPKLKRTFSILTEFKEKRLRAMIYRAFVLRDMHEHYCSLKVAQVQSAQAAVPVQENATLVLEQSEQTQRTNQEQQQLQQAQQLLQRVECHLGQLNFNKGMTKEIRKQLNHTRSLLAAPA